MCEVGHLHKIKSIVNQCKTFIFMSNKKVIIGSLATVVAAGAIGASVTSAHFNGSGTKREAIRSAVENNDFTAFQEATKDFPRNSIDTVDEFSAIVQAHQLRKEGKQNEARAVLENAGIERPFRKGHGPRAEVRNAIETGNLAEFQEAAGESRIAKVIDTKEEFNKLVEAHQLRKEGRHDEAREIMQELGIGKRHKHHRGVSWK